MMDKILVLLLALSLDFIFGEPWNTWHPVAWLGSLISAETRWAPRKGTFTQLAYGAGMIILTLGLIVAAVYFLLAKLGEFNIPAYLILSAILLKCSFSLRGLRQAIRRVGRYLTTDDLDEARLSLKALVGRDTTKLNRNQVISAATESAAENVCDGFTAPLFYFFIFGVPGAVAYRVINTFDSMVGYHGQYEYLGKFTARLDDVANFIPARLTALFIILAASICRHSATQAWKIMVRDHKNTESPNAGWTMSAVAGALQIQLEKVGHYRLGDKSFPLSSHVIDDSRKIVTVTALSWCTIFILAEVTYLVIT